MFPRSRTRFGATKQYPRTRPSRVTLVITRLLGVALAAVLVLPMAEATQPAEAGKKFKTITKVFSSDDLIKISASGTKGPADPYPSTINVKAFKKFKKVKITDVNLTLRDVTHSFPDHIDVMLEHGGTHAVVMGDAGGSADINGITLTLDDQADEVLADGNPLVSGTFRPVNHAGADLFPAPAPVANEHVALATFNGGNPNGAWQVFVFDDAHPNFGAIDGGWELEITARVKGKKGKK